MLTRAQLTNIAASEEEPRLTVNANNTLVENLLDGVGEIDCAGSGNIDLSGTPATAEWNYGTLILTGVRTATGNLIAPAVEMKIALHNLTAYALTVKTSGGTGVQIGAGVVAEVYSDGTDFHAVGVDVSTLAVDANVVHKTEPEEIDDVKTFLQSPIVPDADLGDMIGEKAANLNHVAAAVDYVLTTIRGGVGSALDTLNELYSSIAAVVPFIGDITKRAMSRSVATQTVYVHLTTGDDSLGDGTSAAPFLTLAKVKTYLADAMLNAVVIRIMGGTTTESLDLSDRETRGGVTIEAHNGTRALYENSQATGGSTTNLVRTGAAWTVDMWAGAKVFIHSGAGVNQHATVISNTADTLTFAAQSVAIDSTSLYVLTGVVKFDRTGLSTSAIGLSNTRNAAVKGIWFSNSSATQDISITKQASPTVTHCYFNSLSGSLGNISISASDATVTHSFFHVATTGYGCNLINSYLVAQANVLVGQSLAGSVQAGINADRLSHVAMTAVASTINSFSTLRYGINFNTNGYGANQASQAYTGCTTNYTPTSTGAMTEIATVVVGSGGVASIEFTGIPSTYKNLRVVGMVRGAAGSGTPSFRARVNNSGDTGTVTLYDSQLMYATAASPGGGQTLASSYWELTSMPSAAHTTGLFVPVAYDLPNYAATNTFKGILGDAFLNIPSVAVYVYKVGGLWRDLSAITSLKFFASTGNLAEGSRLTLYGMS